MPLSIGAMEKPMTTNFDRLRKAMEERRAAEAAYKAAWRKDPTAKGFPAVDRALDKLHEAEAEETRLRQLCETGRAFL